MKTNLLRFLSMFVLLAVCVVMVASCSNEPATLNAIEINGKKIECGMDMQTVLELLSDKEYEYTESISCAYNGLDKVYDYVDDGFIIYTYPDGEKDYVLEVAVSSESIKQLKDAVYNGMTKQELIDLFGEDYTMEGDTLNYAVTEKQTMYYLLDGDTVIEYAISIAE